MTLLVYFLIISINFSHFFYFSLRIFKNMSQNLLQLFKKFIFIFSLFFKIIIIFITVYVIINLKVRQSFLLVNLYYHMLFVSVISFQPKV
jgi:hypothetical protein